MYACMHTYIDIHICIYLYIYIYTYIEIDTHISNAIRFWALGLSHAGTVTIALFVPIRY